METNEEIELQLWEYIDGSCSINDMQRIAMLIERDSLWKEKYEELQALHTGISGNLETEQPSMRFTKDVMDAIAAEHIAPATGKYINKDIIRGIAAFFIVILTTVLSYALATADYHTNAPGILSNLNFNKVNISKYLNSTTFNIIIAVNVVLALVLIDTVLRRKRAQHTH